MNSKFLFYIFSLLLTAVIFSTTLLAFSGSEEEEFYRQNGRVIKYNTTFELDYYKKKYEEAEKIANEILSLPRHMTWYDVSSLVNWGSLKTIGNLFERSPENEKLFKKFLMEEKLFTMRPHYANEFEVIHSLYSSKKGNISEEEMNDCIKNLLWRDALSQVIQYDVFRAFLDTKSNRAILLQVFEKGYIRIHRKDAFLCSYIAAFGPSLSPKECNSISKRFLSMASDSGDPERRMEYASKAVEYSKKASEFSEDY